MAYVKTTMYGRDIDHNVRLSDIADYSFLYTVSSTQDTRWNVGDRVTMEGWHGSSFVYSKVGPKAGSYVYPEFLVVNPYRDNTNAVAAASAAAGSSSVLVTIAATDGVAGNGAVAANEYAGGMIVVANGTSQHPECRRIIGNTIVASGGGTTTVYVDGAFNQAITTSLDVEIMPNPFLNIQQPQDTAAHSPYESAVGYCSAIGVPVYTASTGQYVWVQTWGPVWITNPGNTGETSNDRMLWYVGGTSGDGSIRSGAQVTLTNGAAQYLGYALDGSASNASNAPWVFLQLSR